MKQTEIKPSFSVLDLFSGAGGLSEGFWRVGATFVGHVEMDTHACNTLKTRSAYWQLHQQKKIEIYHSYLKNEIDRNTLWEETGVSNNREVINSAIGETTYDQIAKTIRKNMEEKNICSIDILIGGPPCQAYSLIGRSRMGERVRKDKRNWLFQYYVRFLHDFKPKIFLFENVPGLKNANGGHYYNELMKALRREYYVPEPQIHNARDFGVLQNRKRFLIVGRRKDLDFDINDLIESAKTGPVENAIVADLFDDLPSLQPGEEIRGEGKYTASPSSYLMKTGIRSDSFDILTWHVARPHNQRDRDIYREAIELWEKSGKKLRYNDLDERLMTHRNKTSFLDRFNVVKRELAYSHTLVAHIAKDGHYFIHPDKNQLRSLTVREAARVQSFPDDFYFEGPRTAVFTQIGNAVPVAMSEKIAREIIRKKGDLK